MADLDSATTPQALAAVWIAINDEFKMDIPSTLATSSSSIFYQSRFIERWSLAVFYYSTSGPIWRYNLQFMEPIDHCDWYETFIDTTGSIVRMGVTTCERLGTADGEEQRSEDQMVKRIELCKFLFFLNKYDQGILSIHSFVRSFRFVSIQTHLLSNHHSHP